MSTDPTQPLDESILTSESRWWRRPLATARFWENRDMPPMGGQRWRALTGPWGRFYVCIGLGLAFVYRPTTGAALLGILAVTLLATMGRRHWLWYAIPIIAVGVGTGSGEWMAAAVGGIIAGHRIAKRTERPDSVAMRLHLRLAELDGTPTKEEFTRRETFTEAYDRIAAYPPIKGAAGKAGNPARRIRQKDHRPINPVPYWLRLDPEHPRQVADGAYPYRGIFRRYTAACPDDNPDWRERYLNAMAAKLPPMRIPGSDDLTPPSLVAPANVPVDADDLTPGWRTSQDWVYAAVARPMPAQVTLADLPISQWEDTVAIGLTSPDYPVATMIDGVATVIWNLFNHDHACPVAPEPNGIFIGPPGSGKTNAGRTAIHQLREHLRAEIWAIDGKHEGAFAYLDGQEGCRETANPVQAKGMILDAWEEMENRYAANDQARRDGAPLFHWRPIIIVIDEGMSWLDQIANDPDIKGFMAKYGDIVRKGRGARMGILWLTQRPDVQGIVGAGTIGQLRDSMGFKLAGAGTTEDGMRMIAGASNGALAQRIPDRPQGRMGLMVGQDARRFGIVQVALTPDPLARGHDPDGFRRHADRAPNTPPISGGDGHRSPHTRTRVETP